MPFDSAIRSFSGGKRSRDFAGSGKVSNFAVIFLGKTRNYESYRKKVEEFLQEKGCMEDGHASERAVDLIEKIMNEGINEK